MTTKNIPPAPGGGGGAADAGGATTRYIILYGSCSNPSGHTLNLSTLQVEEAGEGPQVGGVGYHEPCTEQLLLL